ncbi:hypothetical protein A4R26_16295 [Niastella populi]|uniref:Uncharacterized protein n=1 Tax=Niastella populi TaxID=550983 RepID=A0A1V9G2B7_9BACT|nr:hypothetical protein A4R26_16295 [Niastella populi]
MPITIGTFIFIGNGLEFILLAKYGIFQAKTIPDIEKISMHYSLFYSVVLLLRIITTDSSKIFDL